MASGVGDAARGYVSRSRSFRLLGAFILNGGKEVVVLVVVVTTVVFVAGAKENWPMVPPNNPESEVSPSSSFAADSSRILGPSTRLGCLRGGSEDWLRCCWGVAASSP